MSVRLSPSGPAGLIDGSDVLVVGLEDDPDGGVRVFIGHRAAGIYAVVDDPEAVAALRAAWADRTTRLVIPRPPTCALRSEP